MIKNILTLLLLISCGGSSSPSTNNTRSTNPKRDTNKKEDVSKVTVKGDDIVSAIINGNVDDIKKLLKDIDNINNFSKEIMPNSNWSFIHLAAINDRNEILKLLLAKGPKVDEIIEGYSNGRDEYQYMTALMIASKEGYLDIVNTLIKAKADVNVIVKFVSYTSDNDANKYKHRTALHFAVINEHKEIVAALTEAGADVNATDAKGKKAVAYTNNPEMKELLREKTVDIFTAAANGDIDAVKEYIESIEDINVKDREIGSKTALQHAVENDHEETVKELLKAGATIDKESIHSDGSVKAAVENGSVPIIKLLLKDIDDIDNAENITFTDKNKIHADTSWPLLHLAAHHNKKEVVEYLLSKGAKVDKLIKYNSYIGQKEYNYQNITALMIASKEGYLDIVKILVEKGANIDLQMEWYFGMREFDKYTALHFAAENGHKEVVEYLLGENADSNIKNKRDKTPLRLAINTENFEIAEILLEKENEIDISLLKYTISSIDRNSDNSLDLSFINVLLEKENIKNNINEADNSGYTALHYAAKVKNSKDLLKILIDKGADVNLEIKIPESALHKQEDKYTALHFAANKDNSEAKEVVEMLKGADNININKQDRFGRTPLHSASLFRKKEMVKALLEAGASVDIEDMNGKKANSYNEITKEIKDIFEEHQNA